MTASGRSLVIKFSNRTLSSRGLSGPRFNGPGSVCRGRAPSSRVLGTSGYPQRWGRAEIARSCDSGPLCPRARRAGRGRTLQGRSPPHQRQEERLGRGGQRKAEGGAGGDVRAQASRGAPRPHGGPGPRPGRPRVAGRGRPGLHHLSRAARLARHAALRPQLLPRLPQGPVGRRLRWAPALLPHLPRERRGAAAAAQEHDAAGAGGQVQPRAAPGCHIIRTIQFISFPDWLLSLSKVMAAAQKCIKEVGRELTELVEQLVGIVRNLQSQKHLPESGPENERSTLSMGMSSSDGADLALASSKPVTSDTPERKMKDILHDLEEIQKKLQENFTWKGALEEHLQVKLQEAPSSSSHPLPDHSCPAPRRAFQFAQWAISPTFDLRSHSCSLEVSEDCRVVTVSHWPQTHLWSHERFVTCQVLCSQAFSSGQQYWEVDTQHCSHWAVGVASWGMRRTQILGRTKDSYCVEWKGNSQLSAWHMVRETVLGSDRPKVVGIWLDLEEGKLAFYSVADQETLLYECPVSASSPLHPAFWLYGLNPGNSLTIRPVNV
ncbi:E3 ubiquitin-protein ligase RNF135 isoform X1 [Vulpes vulpes]|uniref:E3 ubiquitin-protein ligase RNF135 isoform X1 n=1 Tax=Vulpes vulpes TaxID=9627 RepID=A0ABM4ZMS1_VULVU